MKKVKFLGFTLAEVLITLGIIGVISAMAIPGLINTYRAHAMRSQFFKSYSVIKQVHKNILNDSSPSVFQQHGYYKMFISYLKGATDCGTGYTTTLPCAYTRGASAREYKNLKGNTPMTRNYLDDGQIALLDGTLLMFENQDSTDSMPLYIFVDLNGHAKLPNRLGIDTFAFQMVNDEILPMGAAGTAFDIEQYCSKSSNAANNGIACTQKAISDPNYFKDMLTGLK